MQHVKIEPIGAEPQQATLASPKRALKRRVRGQYFTRQKYFVAPVGDRRADDFFGRALYISAVSMSFMPRSRPKRKVAMAEAMSPLSKYHVP